MKAPDPVVQEVVADAGIGEPVVLETDLRRSDSINMTGRGVVVGVVDWGADFAHPNFRTPDGRTRLLALWDQRGVGSVDPEPFGYGTVHSAKAINRALATSDPYTTLGYHPADADSRGDGSHGTHVLDIAAGNGLAGGPIGMAPEAHLVFVHLASSGDDDPAELGHSVTLLEAIDFILRTAALSPCAINISMGNLAGPHDGTTLVEQAFNDLLVAAPGRAICQSTGNYLRTEAHAAIQLWPGERRTLRWITEAGDRTPNELEFWYSGRDRLSIEVESPGGDRSLPVHLGARGAVAVDGAEVCRIHHRTSDPNNGDNQIAVFLIQGAPAGDWRLTLSAIDVVDGRVHGWIERDEGCKGCQSRFPPGLSSRASTTGSICNSYRAIAVGAYDAHVPTLDPAPFSSMGPTRDGRQKPDLCAPGVRVLATRSTPRGSRESTLTVRKSGTSMATPHVTGAVALMFEAARTRLSIDQTRSALMATARRPATVAESDVASRIGSGYLDVERAVAAAVQINGRHAADEVLREKGTTMAFNGNDQEVVEGEDFDEFTEPFASSEGPADFGNSISVRPQSPGEQLIELVESSGQAECRCGRGEQVLPHTVPSAGTEFLRSPRALFDAISASGAMGLRPVLEGVELIAAPRAPLLHQLRAGDVLVRRALGEGNLSHIAVVAEPHLLRAEELADDDVLPEGRQPGWYAQVVERGARPHTRSDRFARRILDETGRLPVDQALVRPVAPLRREDLSGALGEAPPTPRTCCILAPTTRPLSRDENLADPANLGTHGASTEVRGLIYTCQAGFVDLGHLRDLCDLTKYIYDQILAASGSPKSVLTTHGEAQFYGSPAHPMRVARAIAYDDSFGYEIYTYDEFSPGMHNSSFSPEDLPSNYLGTLVAERAVAAGGAFASAVTSELNKLLAALGGQAKAESLRAFNQINHRWVDFDGITSLLSDGYLKRRNFDRVPWKAGHSCDQATPDWVTAEIGNVRKIYRYTHTYHKKIPEGEFPAEVARIRLDAQRRYKDGYDKP
jgi:subtilisin family serine protease